MQQKNAFNKITLKLSQKYKNLFLETPAEKIFKIQEKIRNSFIEARDFWKSRLIFSQFHFTIFFVGKNVSWFQLFVYYLK